MLRIFSVKRFSARCVEENALLFSLLCCFFGSERIRFCADIDQQTGTNAWWEESTSLIELTHCERVRHTRTARYVSNGPNVPGVVVVSMLVTRALMFIN